MKNCLQISKFLGCELLQNAFGGTRWGSYTIALPRPIAVIGMGGGRARGRKGLGMGREGKWKLG